MRSEVSRRTAAPAQVVQSLRLRLSVTCVLALCAWTLIAASGCSLGRTRTTEREGIDGSSQSTSFGVHLSAAEGTLARARQAIMEGRFDDATAAFTEVADDTAASKEHRAEALLELGRAHASMVNPKRDVAVSRGYYQRVIDEYPESEVREEAEESLERLADAP